MAISRVSIAICFLFLSVLLRGVSPVSSDDVISELSALQSQSTTGVIHLSNELVGCYLYRSRVHSTPWYSSMPNSFILSPSSHSQLSNLHLPLSLPLFNPITLIRNLNFFFEIEFQQSQSSFQLFGVNSLPHIRLIPPSASNMKADSIAMEASDFSRLADSMGDFINARTEFSVGPIHRLPLISKKMIMFVVVVILIWAPYFLKKLISGKTVLHNRSTWMTGAISIYFFSVSGAMFNIIRKMPMVMADRQNPAKMVFFYQGSGMQLGAEGFSIGFLYTIVGLLLAFVTHALVMVKNGNVQRLLMMFSMFVSFWAVKKVVFLDNWKTGYAIHGYWPTSWR